jgi:hypothetical protein
MQNFSLHINLEAWPNFSMIGYIHHLQTLLAEFIMLNLLLFNQLIFLI